MVLDAAILIVACFINLLLGAIVYSRNPKLPVSISFGLMSVSVVVWTTTNFLTNLTYSTLVINNIFNRLAFVAGYVVLLFGLWFTYNFPVAKKVSARTVNLLGGAALITIILAATSYVSGDVTRHKGTLAFSNGPLVWLYALSFILVLSFIIKNLMLGFSKKSGQVKQQSLLVLYGFTLAALLGLVTNLLIPVVQSDWETARFGPLFTVILVGTISYAIIRHGLFNIRSVVARAVGYVASIAVLASVYGLIVFGVANLLFDLRISIAAQIFLSLATGFAAPLFQAPIRYFNKVTNRIFFRDAYDSQTLIDEFNKVLVSTYDLDMLLHKGAHIITENLKSSYTVFGIRETENTSRRIVGTQGHPLFAESDIALVRSMTPKMHEKLIVTDLLEPRNADLQKVLQANNIAVLARLGTSTTEEGIGYLVLGPKKSGNPYSTQDLNVIGILANGLVVAVQNSLRFEEIKNFNLTLQQKVVEATRKLRHSNEKLKALDETKDDFISMASHQLRTPLTSVKGYISMVLEGDAGKISPMQKEMLNQAFFSSQRMVFLIADLLNVSRLKTGKFVIEPIRLNLAKLVQEELEQLKDTAASRGLTIRFDRPDTFPDLMIDETKTRQVIMNFVDNAIYYTPAGGEIVVTLTETPSSIELRVSDNGIGVPKAEQHHLFNKFYRAANARKARPDGTGLGLFMAKKVVVGQGGSVLFESQEGKGSTFGFVFSKNKLQVEPAAPAVVAVAQPPTAPTAHTKA